MFDDQILRTSRGDYQKSDVESVISVGRNMDDKRPFYRLGGF
jgi:hypothetical protein